MGNDNQNSQNQENLNIDRLKRLYSESIMRKKVARLIGTVLMFISFMNFGYIIFILITNFLNLKDFWISILVNLIIGITFVFVIISNKSIRRALE